MWKSLVVVGVSTTLILPTLTQAGHHYEKRSSQGQYRESNVPFKCTEEGYHPDPRDCRTYYRCVDWGNGGPLTTFRFECGIGTVFSKNKGNVCTHPNDSERPECGHSENEIDSDAWDTPEQQQQQQQHQSPSTNGITSESTTTRLPQTITTGQSTTWTTRPTSSHVPPSQGNECIGEGFMADQRDCRKFYRCVGEGSGKLHRYEFTCGTGTVWDPRIDGCNHAWAAMRDNCMDLGGGSNNGDVQGQPAETGRPRPPTTTTMGRPSTYLPPGTTQASFPSSPSVSLPTSLLPPSESPSITTQGLPSTQAAANSPQTTPISPVSSPQGSSECEREGFFPDPRDCTKFYRCVSEDSKLTKYEFKCGTGTAWDTNLETCNHFNSVPSCAGQSINTNEPSESTDSSMNEINEPESSSRPSTSVSISPEPTSGYPPSSAPPSYLPPSRPTQSTSGTSSGYPSSSVSNSPDPTSGYPPSYLPPSKPTQGTSGTSSQGSTDCSQEGFFPHSSDCTKFYRCVLEDSTLTKYEFQCGSGTAWDQDLQTCNHYHSVTNCQGSSGISSSKPVDSTDPSINEVSDVGQPSPTYLPPSSSTTNIAGTSSYPSPPTYSPPGSTTTNTAGTPTNPPPPTYLPPSSSSTSPTQGQQGTALAAGGSSKICTGEGFFPNPNDCTKFYRCVNDGPTFRKFEFQCGPGTAWDQALLTCNYRHQVSSCRRGPSTSPTQISTTTSIPSSPPLPTSPTDTPPSDVSKPNDTITCDGDGFNPHPTDCMKFYRCVDNGNGYNVYHFDCPPGTVFDPSINVCNYPESVYPQRDCSGSATVKPSSTTEMTTVESETTSTEAESSTPTDSTTMMSISSEGTTTSSTDVTESSTEQNSDSTTESTTEPSSTSSTESSSESTTDEMNEQTTTESDTTESTSESANQEPESTTSPPATESSGQPCSVGNLTEEQLVLVCPTGFRRHPKFCNMFYQCTNDERTMEVRISVLRCPEGTIFDGNKMQCLKEEESSEPCMTEMASARFIRILDATPMSPVKVSSSPLCPKEGHHPYQTGYSRAFYKCEKDSRNSLQGYLYRCPKNYVYWSVSRRCEMRSRVCAWNSHLKMTDNPDCDDQSDDWENRWQIPIALSARMLRV